MTESVLLSLIGGIAGTALAYASIQILVAFDVGNLPRVEQLTVDGRILLFTLLVSLGTGLLFGLAPSLAMARNRTSESLKEGGRGTEGSSPGHARMRHVLVVGEISEGRLGLTSKEVLAVGRRLADGLGPAS